MKFMIQIYRLVYTTKDGESMQWVPYCGGKGRKPLEFSTEEAAENTSRLLPMPARVVPIPPPL